MELPQIVIDTNILVSAIRSNQGASFKLLSLIGKSKFEFHVSVPLVIEYEDALKRQVKNSPLTNQDIDDLLDYLCKVAKQQSIFFLWRPQLKDPKDDLVLELAVNSGSQFIVTYNIKDFEQSEKFGVKAIKPHEFLKMIGVK